MAFWADHRDAVLADYETARQDTERDMAARGMFSSGAHYAAFRNNAINYTQAWTNGARQIVLDMEEHGTTDRVFLSDLAEDYRTDFLNYMLASYDSFHARAGAGSNVYTQVKDEIVAGIHAAFDELQAAI